MKYQVWTKESYEETWRKVDCTDREAALVAIDKVVRAGINPMLTIEVPFELSIKVKEVPVEITESETKPDQDSAGQGDGKV